MLVEVYRGFIYLRVASYYMHRFNYHSPSYRDDSITAYTREIAGSPQYSPGKRNKKQNNFNFYSSTVAMLNTQAQDCIKYSVSNKTR